LFTNRTYIHFVTRQKIKEFINYKKTKIAYPLDVFHNKKDEKTKENTIDSVLKNTIRSWSDVECHRILSKFLSKFLFGQIKFIPIEIERILNICDVKEKQELVKWKHTHLKTIRGRGELTLIIKYQLYDKLKFHSVFFNEYLNFNKSNYIHI